MDRAGTGFLIVIGMILAFLFGRGYQAARRAWADYKVAKATVPVLLRAFWAAVRAALVIGMLGLLYFVGSIYFAGSGVAEPERPAAPKSPAASSAPR